MYKFYHTIGFMDHNGKIIFDRAYKLEQFWYHLRQFIAFIICPELRVQANKERYNLDYIVRVRKEQAAECKARDKAINRLQKKLADHKFLLKKYKIIK